MSDHGPKDGREFVGGRGDGAWVPILGFCLRNQSPSPAFERCSEWAAMLSSMANRLSGSRVWRLVQCLKSGGMAEKAEQKFWRLISAWRSGGWQSKPETSAARSRFTDENYPRNLATPANVITTGITSATRSSTALALRWAKPIAAEPSQPTRGLRSLT